MVLGAGGHGREVLDLVDAVNGAEPRYRVVGVVDDAPERPDLVLARGVPMLDGLDDPRVEGAAFVAGIFFVIQGCVAMVRGFVDPELRGFNIFLGIINAVVGIVILSWPKLGLATFAILIGVALILQGIGTMAVGLALRRL